MALLISIFVPHASASSNVTVLNVNFQTIKFNGGAFTSGNLTTEGSTYKYTNIYTTSVDGTPVQVDCIATIEKISNAAFGTFDDDTAATANADGWCPTVSSSKSSGGNCTVRFDFINHADNTPIYIKDYYVTGNDIDGSKRIEFQEISGYVSYQLSKDTGLAVTTTGTILPGGTRFTAMDGDHSGISFADNSAYIAKYSSIISSMKIVIGVTATASTARQIPTQYTDDFYAFMVYPHTRYYIKATAPGYYDYDSRTDSTQPIIDVKIDLVKHNIEMTPISGGGSGGSGGGGCGGAVVTPETNPIDLAVAIKSSSMSVIEGNSVTLTITYKNKSAYDADGVYVTGDVPASMSFVSAGNEGTLSGSTIKWALGTLKAGQTGTVIFVLKAKSMSEAEDFAIVTSKVGSNAKLNLINLEDDTSFVKLNLLSISGEHQHQRYIKGYPDNTVRPLDIITRAEIAAIFARIMDLEGNVTHASTYSDVTTNFWAAEYIETASKAGVMKGYADGNFKPNQPITRAELATVIARYLGIVREANLDQFLDLGSFSDTSGSWAQQTINELFRYAVVSGYADGSFKPDQNITRSEAIKMINRMLYRGPLTDVEASFPDCTKDKWYFGDMEESIRTHKYTLGSDGCEIMTECIEESLW
jgi:uncharacterized repeat protein (TIGR01451 family)